MRDKDTHTHFLPPRSNSTLVGEMVRRRQREAQRNHILTALLVAAIVAGLMAAFDAPTWAWLGIGLLTYIEV